jgi:hypothetical protein
MPVGHPLIRVSSDNPLHHLWLNNGTWWVHYTLNFDFRTRRVRRSLGTRDAAEAVRRRDELFARLAWEGELVPERRPNRGPAAPFSTAVNTGGPRVFDARRGINLRTHADPHRRHC